jgi:hypothetical protein
MKLSEIMAMEAGPELDKLVAEKVMGWRIHSRATAFYVDADKVDDIIVGPSYRDKYEWNPSRDIATAFEVVGNLPSMGLLMEIKQYDDGFLAVIGKQRKGFCNGRSYFTGGQYSTSLPLAICREVLIVIFKERGELEE